MNAPPMVPKSTVQRRMKFQEFEPDTTASPGAMNSWCAAHKMSRITLLEDGGPPGSGGEFIAGNLMRSANIVGKGVRPNPPASSLPARVFYLLLRCNRGTWPPSGKTHSAFLHPCGKTAANDGEVVSEEETNGKYSEVGRKCRVNEEGDMCGNAGKCSDKEHDKEMKGLTGVSGKFGGGGGGECVEAKGNEVEMQGTQGSAGDRKRKLQEIKGKCKGTEGELKGKSRGKEQEIERRMKGERRKMKRSEGEMNGNEGRCRELTGNEWDMNENEVEIRDTDRETKGKWKEHEGAMEETIEMTGRVFSNKAWHSFLRLPRPTTLCQPLADLASGKFHSTEVTTHLLARFDTGQSVCVKCALASALSPLACNPVQERLTPLSMAAMA